MAISARSLLLAASLLLLSGIALACDTAIIKYRSTPVCHDQGLTSAEVV